MKPKKYADVFADITLRTHNSIGDRQLFDQSLQYYGE